MKAILSLNVYIIFINCYLKFNFQENFQYFNLLILLFLLHNVINGASVYFYKRHVDESIWVSHRMRSLIEKEFCKFMFPYSQDIDFIDICYNAICLGQFHHKRQLVAYVFYYMLTSKSIKWIFLSSVFDMSSTACMK